MKQTDFFRQVHPTEEPRGLQPPDERGGFVIAIVADHRFWGAERTVYASRQIASERIERIYYQHLVPLRVIPVSWAGQEAVKSTCEHSRRRVSEDRRCTTCAECGDEVYSVGDNGRALGKWRV